MAKPVWVGRFAQGMREVGQASIITIHPSFFRLGDGVLVELDGTEDRGLEVHGSEGKNMHSSDMLSHP